MKARKSISTCCFRGKAVCVLCSLWERQQQETWGCRRCCCCCVEGWPHRNDWSQVTSGHTDSVPPRWRVVARREKAAESPSPPGTVSLRLLLCFCFFFSSPPSKSMLRLPPAKQNFTGLHKFAKCDDVCCCGGGGASCFWSWLIAEASQVFTGNFVSSFHSPRRIVHWARGTNSHSFLVFFFLFVSLSCFLPQLIGLKTSQVWTGKRVSASRFVLFCFFFSYMNFNSQQVFGVRGRLTPFETGPGGWKWAQPELDSPSSCWLVWPPVEALQTK